MKMKKVIYDSFQETRFKLSVLAFILIAEADLKYINDPVGMLNDSQYCDFAIPFRDYAKAEISFEEARARLDDIRMAVIENSAEKRHDEFLKSQHEKISGGDLIEDLNSLRSQDERVQKGAALRILKSFPETRSRFEDVKSIITKAIADDDFLNEFIKNIDEKKKHHAKRDFKLIGFKIFNEEALRDPDLTEEGVLKMADKQKLDYQSPESLLKYLRREGIKIRSTKQNQCAPTDTRAEFLHKFFKGNVLNKEALNDPDLTASDVRRIGEEEKLIYQSDIMNKKKAEFKKYLLGDTPVKERKQQIGILKKSLGIK